MSVACDMQCDAQQSTALDDLIGRLLEMGYTQAKAEDSATEALKRCSSVEAALEWIFNRDTRKEPSETLVDQFWNSTVELFDGVLSRAWGQSANMPLPEAVVKQLCNRARAIFAEEKNILAIDGPVTIVGDIHGQFHDLVEIFDAIGTAPEVHYVFLGDYVDRGSFSVETIQFLVALKVRHPSRVTLLRGNHESAEMSLKFGFYNEVKRKYGSTRVWGHFTELFNYLPLGCLIDNAIFCLHGGLSPDAETLDEIRSLDRVQEIPKTGAIVDLLWSDPSENIGWKDSHRGAGYLFGPDVTEKFNHANGLRYICRAHEMVTAGYKWMHAERIVTVFSAPNYCNMHNQSAALTIGNDGECDFRQFSDCTNPRTLGVERSLIESLLDELGADTTSQ